MNERATFTPGPWTADTGDHEGTDVLTGYHDNCYGVMATIHNQPGEDMPGTVEVANARLIAAAPELLAALELMVDMFERHINGQEGPDDAADRWDAARAAIDKATNQGDE